MADLYDISPPLTPGLAVFPGDTPLSREVLARLEDGATVTLSSLRTTVHLGAHVDAPAHYQTGGAGIDETPLERLLGPCRVARVERLDGGMIEASDLSACLEGSGDLPSRVLLSTGSYPDPERWDGRFAALTPEGVDWLAGAGVKTIGLDTPSVDPADSGDLPAHRQIARHGMTILEGLVLDGVPPGDYELIALPLRLVGFDGSPVRAVLRTLT